MDNLGSHKAKAVRQLIRAAGAKLFLAGPEPDRTGLRQAQALVAQGRRVTNRRNPPSIYAHPTPTISETQAMPNPKSIML